MLPVANGRCTAVSWDLPRSVSSNRPRILASTLLSWEKKRIVWPYLFSHVVVRLVVPVVVVGPLQERIISSMTVALMIISVFINILLYLPLLCLLPPCLLVLGFPLRSVSGKSCGIACFCRYREICSMTLWWLRKLQNVVLYSYLNWRGLSDLRSNVISFTLSYENQRYRFMCYYLCAYTHIYFDVTNNRRCADCLGKLLRQN